MFALADLIRGRQKPAKRQKTVDLKPIVFVRFNTRLGKAKTVTLRALLDSGGSGSLVAEEFAKKLRLKKSKTGAQTVWTTPAGKLETTTKCQAQFMLPELHDNKMISWDLHVTKNLGAYDMIIGRDILTGLGIDLQFSNNTITWDHSEIPFKDSDATLEDTFHIGEPSVLEEAAERLKGILDAKYEAADLNEVAHNCTHLDEDEQRKLKTLLDKYSTLFDGTLGSWNETTYDIELREDAVPYHAKAYPIPRIHMDTLKLEVERLCEIGVLKRVNRSEWAAPTFIIPKKDGSVRFISDFRELNKRIKRKPYPIPKIQDLMLKLEGFQYATSLDLNMGYYHIELSPGSKRLCTIVLPFGKFEYQRLPMGLCNSPDIFQEKMSDLMLGLEFVRAYIDDLLAITTGNFDDHLEKLELVFQRLLKAGLKVNAKKSFFARGELEYLGYWITREGIQPLPKKVEAIQNIAEPTNKKALRSFIGLINYYRDMWVRRSHVLAPLARLTSKAVKWSWGDAERAAFNTMKKIISKEVLLAYPDFTKPFVIHTDASHTQLGAVISQDNKPIAFYSRKLNPAQTRYTTTERELLSIVETLKEFRNILLGQQIEVHTDHKNLTCKGFNTERVMRWRLLLEEYGPDLKYIKGEDNIVADALSRLGMTSPETNEIFSLERMSELFAATENDVPSAYPLSLPHLAKEQGKEKALRAKAIAQPNVYTKKTIHHGDKSYEIVMKNEKIVVPKTLQKRAVEWYHGILMHPGEQRTEFTMAQHYTWKGMRSTIQSVCKRCVSCQLTKPKSKKYGHLPPKEAEAIPWDTLCIDLIGPYQIGTGRNGLTLHCLTMIDPATGWFEIAEIPNKRADEVSNILEQAWLVRYPWPTKVVMDRGREFMGEVRDMLKDDYGIVRKPITTRNPQANAMVERAHQTIHNLIRSQQIRGKSDLVGGDWSGLLSAVGFAMRATVHTTARATPSQLVFGRDAMLNVGFEADWQYIKERKQRLIVQNNKRENATRLPHVYSVGDQVLVATDPNRKYGEDRYKGPFEVTAVNDNGTLTLRQDTPRGGAVLQTWNLRNIVPYKA
jgi:transposase InsO family protein